MKKEMEFKNIYIEKKNSIAYIIINRPEVRNALNEETLEELIMSITKLQNCSSIGCLVFTGSGDKSFAAGADIKQIAKKTDLDILTERGMQRVCNLIENSKKPTIAMVNGYALGGGCELALACDIRLASTNAKLGLPELGLSIIPGAGGTQRLARIVGKGKALEMILMSKIISADEALRFGLVSEVTEPQELRIKTEEYASRIIKNGPLAIQMAKLAINIGTETDLNTALIIEQLSQAILFNSDDKKEGTSAFLEKRKPNFKGK